VKDASIPSGPAEEPSSRAEGGEPRKLSRRSIAICLGLSLLVFLFWGGPIWRHSADIDAAAWWSYAVIAPLVAVFLLLERRFGLVAFALAVIEITAWKFFATYLFAHTMWMMFPPLSPPKESPPPAPVVAAVEPTPSVIDPARTGTLDGHITTSSQAPVEGAIVYIDAGLEPFVFAPPETPLRVVEGKGTIELSSAVAQVGQKVEARSGDLALHTLIATLGEGDVFSIALQSSGAWSSAKLSRTTGVATLHCGVHQRSTETARLVITANPFWSRTEAGGQFRLSGVPVGKVHLTVVTDDGRTTGAETTVDAGSSSAVVLVL
jgi:hypothetical protein